eukprot:TRINITY_DN2720_c4_g1_i1.p3 TRINITY_DN2720_c4_g1~~TRINITY_DN2720_c4_g1_i1.p3  ORF type:complete len:812 (-),score=166.49 TRINITY_DN2720_c4_g1_i1:4303-6738(-)
MEDEEIRKEKQDYLCEKILNKGYDTEEFVAYLQSLKRKCLQLNGQIAEGDDVDNWTMEELTDVVTKFIETHPMPEATATSEDAVEPSVQETKKEDSSLIKEVDAEHEKLGSELTEKASAKLEYSSNKIHSDEKKFIEDEFRPEEPAVSAGKEIKVEESDLNKEAQALVENVEKDHNEPNPTVIYNFKPITVEEKDIVKTEGEKDNNKAEEKPKVEKDIKVEDKPEIKNEIKDQEKPEAKVEPKIEGKVEQKEVEQKLEELKPKVELKESSKTVSKVEAKAEEKELINVTQKAEMQKEVMKPKPKVEMKQVPKVEQRKEQLKPSPEPQKEKVTAPVSVPKKAEQKKEPSPTVPTKEVKKEQPQVAPKPSDPKKTPAPLFPRNSVINKETAKVVPPAPRPTEIKKVPPPAEKPKEEQKHPDAPTSTQKSAATSKKGLPPMFLSVPKEIVTKELSENDLKSKKIKIKVLEPKIKEGGLFSSTVVNFTIETAPYSWRVLRRYKDCLILREHLQKYFPAAMIPPLDKKWAKDKTDPKWISEASSRMQKFFTELQRDPMLRSTEMTYYFLALTERVQYDNKIKAFSKAHAPGNVSEIKHFAGKAKVELSPEIVQLSNNWLGYAPAAKQLYEKMEKSMNETDKVMSLLGEMMGKNAALFKEFAVLHEKVECSELADLFNTLKTMSSYLTELYKKQAGLIREKFGSFFEYFQEEVDSIAEVGAILDNAKKNFISKEQQLYLKKEKLFNEGNTQLWEIPADVLSKHTLTELAGNKQLAFPFMLPKVSSITNNIRKQQNQERQGRRTGIMRTKWQKKENEQ